MPAVEDGASLVMHAWHRPERGGTQGRVDVDHWPSFRHFAPANCALCLSKCAFSVTSSHERLVCSDKIKFTAHDNTASVFVFCFVVLFLFLIVLVLCCFIAVLQVQVCDTWRHIIKSALFLVAEL